MTDLDLAIVSALRTQAQEAGMRTDTARQFELLTTRIGHVDATRRRRVWLAASAAVVAGLVVVGATAVVLRSTPDTSPEDPAPAPSASVWTSTPTSSSPSAFQRPLELELPVDLRTKSFTVRERASVVGMGTGLYRCVFTLEEPCPDGEDFALWILTPRAIYDPARAPASSPMPDYAGYARFVDSLDGHGGTVSGRRAATVDGHRATIWSLRTAGLPDAALGCESTSDPIQSCWGYTAAPAQMLAVEFAVIDQGPTPVLIWSQRNASNPRSATLAAEFDRLLATIRFH